MPESSKDIAKDIGTLLGLGNLVNKKQNAGSIVLGIITGSFIGPSDQSVTGIFIKWFGGNKEMEKQAKTVGTEQDKQKQVDKTIVLINMKTAAQKVEWARERQQYLNLLNG